MKFLSLFSGIGGFDLGLERAGMECVGQVEIDSYCQAVLKKHWPNVKRMGDIKNVEGTEFGSVDLICGGFPCQPFSTAGKRKGADDNRFLWPEMLRIIQRVQPGWIIGENVRGILSLESGMVFEKCCTDLEGIGYEVRAFVIPACAIGAPHRRDRVWIVAYSKFGRGSRAGGIQGSRKDKSEMGQGASETTLSASGNAPNPRYTGLQGGEWPGSHDEKPSPHGSTTERNHTWDENWPSVASRLCRVDDGVSDRVHRLKALGNAVVPQIVEEIGKAIMISDGAQDKDGKTEQQITTV